MSQVSFVNSPYFFASMILLILGVLAFLLMAYLINRGHDPLDILKTFGIPLIVLSAVSILVTGHSTSELSPVIGLLGTIAGYLLGKAGQEPLVKRTSPPEKSENKKTPPEEKKVESNKHS